MKSLPWFFSTSATSCLIFSASLAGQTRVALGVWMMMRSWQLMVVMRWPGSSLTARMLWELRCWVRALAARLPVESGVKCLTEGGPASDVEPFDGHGDGGDMGGFFHDGEVDRHFGKGGVDRVEGFLLARGVPCVGDFHEAAVGVGEVLFELLKDGAGLPDEHAGVPGVVSGGEILFGGFFVGFFLEGEDVEDAGAVGEFGASLDVSEAGGGESGGDAEGDEGFGMLVDGVEGFAERGLKDINGLDDVVSGEDGEGGVGVVFVEDGGGESDGVGGVAAHGFAEEL